MNENFWNEKYGKERLGWDIGYISTPLKEYIDQLSSRKLRILVPGAGNSYEAEYLFRSGHLDTHVLDISKIPLGNFKTRIPEFPNSQLHHADFFNFSGQFDLIIEQTFLSAIQPSLRPDYVHKMHALLRPKGKIIGLLFKTNFDCDGPPFGGEEADYRRLFNSYFEIDIMQESYNSIPERQGNELFIKLTKRSNN